MASSDNCGAASERLGQPAASIADSRGATLGNVADGPTTAQSLWDQNVGQPDDLPLQNIAIPVNFSLEWWSRGGSNP